MSTANDAPAEDRPGEGEQDAQAIDLAEVRRLVDALEQDLALVQVGAADVDTLRVEVDALRSALHADDAETGVGPHLQRVHSRLENTLDILQADAVRSADYLTRIGRLLGL